MMSNIKSYGSFVFLALLILTQLLEEGEGRLSLLKVKQPASGLTTPRLPTRGTSPAVPQALDGFVQSRDEHFYLGRRLFDFRGFK